MQSVLERQCDKVLVREKCRFFDFNWLPWQRPLRNQQKAQWGEQALTPGYQSWNFGEDWSVRFWATGLESWPLKIETKTLAKYIALPASVPSGLNQQLVRPSGLSACSWSRYSLAVSRGRLPSQSSSIVMNCWYVGQRTMHIDTGDVFM